MNHRNREMVPGSPGEWLKHAESDIALAHLAAGHAEIRAEQICFHAQQAAEKAIKAVLLSKAIEFPLTHDIEQLLELAENGGLMPPKGVQEASLLTPYAVETRYPGYGAEITHADVDEALRTARETVSWAKGFLSPAERGEDP